MRIAEDAGRGYVMPGALTETAPVRKVSFKSCRARRLFAFLLPLRREASVTLDDLRAAKREAILAIAAKHGVTSIRVFGSFARGQAREDSDLDLLIEAGPIRTPWFPGGLLADLEEELGRGVDVVEENGLHRLVRSQVLKEAVPF